MKKIKYFSLMLLIPLLSGCYNYRELNELAITTSISIDYSENNYTSDGYVAISSAEDNISKENVLYNFDYFIQVGLLEKM